MALGPLVTALVSTAIPLLRPRLLLPPGSLTLNRCPPPPHPTPPPCDVAVVPFLRTSPLPGVGVT